MTTTIARKIINHTLGRTYYKRRFRPRVAWEHLRDYLETPTAFPDQGTLIAPGYLATNTFRTMFGRALSPYLERDMKTDGHETWIAKIHQGRIDTDKSHSVAVSNRYNQLLGDLSFQFVPHPDGIFSHGSVGENNVFHRPYLSHPYRVRGTVFSMLTGGGGNINFYHWFLDVLGRLAVLEQSSWKNEIDYYLVPNTLLPFQLASLELLGIPKEKVIDGMRYPHVLADELVVCSHPRTTTYFCPDYLTSYLQNVFAKVELEKDPAFVTHPLVYINRGDAPKRKVLNESVVEAILEQYGFRSYSLSELSLKQSMQLFRQAKIVVAPHGAGLTNLIFCQPGTQLIELFSDKFVNHYFYELASNLGLAYDFMVGSPINDHQVQTRFQGVEEDMFIDAIALEQKVQRLLQGV